MKYAVVTGASGGLGREFARLLARRKHNVLLVSRNLDALEALAADLRRDYGVDARAVAADLSSPGTAAALVSQLSDIGEIEILINNAAVGVFGLSADVDAGTVTKMLMLNVVALTELSARCAAGMRERGGGYILNVSSMVGKWPEPYLASYAASKSYVNSYSIALARELQGTGVSVTCLLPGFIRTGFDENANIRSERYRRFSYRNGMSAETVAKIGLTALFSRRITRIAGVSNHVAAAIAAVLPARTLAMLFKKGIARLAEASKDR